MPSGRIGLSSIEEINGGFRKGLCYITTAVCNSLDKEDECFELNTLRKYRDEYLLSTIDGEKIVNGYYNIAPTIVNRINKSKDSNEIYQEIWSTYISPCITLISDNKNEECKELYSKMVTDLEIKYM
jgi:hypothetical protein